MPIPDSNPPVAAKGFDYLSQYGPEEEGRCVAGWKNKIGKDAAVPEHIGLTTGQATRLSDLRGFPARRIGPEGLYWFCGHGEWECEYHALDLCREGLAKLRRRLGIGCSQQEK